MKEVFFVVEKALEGGFTAKALDESIFTEAETMEELHVNVKEAVECHFNADSMPRLVTGFV